jgi:tetratricopeptide (TPR) repeat protein
LLACSLFDRTAGAAREALGQITDLSHADRDRALAQLLKLCLVNRSESDRFWMLPIVQRYAAAQLPFFMDQAQLVDRWLEWLLDIARTAGESLEAHIESIEILNREYPNLLLAIEWCREHGQWAQVIRLVGGAWFYPYLTGQLSSTRDLLNLAGLAARELGDERALGKIEGLFGRVEIAYDQNVDEALLHLETAETLARRYHDNEQLGWAWTNRCVALLDRGEIREAEQLAQGARQLGEQEHHTRLKSTGAMRLSECEAKKGNYAEALHWLDRAEEDIAGEGLSRHQSWIASFRGYYLLRQGRPAEAIPHLEQVLATRSTWGDRRGEAHSKHHLALAYAALGQTDTAKQYAGEAQDLYERLGITSEVIKTDSLLRSLEQA